MYEIRFLKRAEKELKKIKDKNLIQKIKLAINKIAENPYIGQAKKGDLSGIYGYDVYYNKTNYEISYKIYEYEDKKIIIILIGTRENFYKELKKYLKEII